MGARPFHDFGQFRPIAYIFKWQGFQSAIRNPRKACAHCNPHQSAIRRRADSRFRSYLGSLGVNRRDIRGVQIAASRRTLFSRPRSHLSAQGVDRRDVRVVRSSASRRTSRARQIRIPATNPMIPVIPPPLTASRPPPTLSTCVKPRLCLDFHSKHPTPPHARGRAV